MSLAGQYRCHRCDVYWTPEACCPWCGRRATSTGNPVTLAIRGVLVTDILDRVPGPAEDRADRWVQAGRTPSARMGHASMSAALQYQHATEDADQAIADALGEVMERATVTELDDRRAPGNTDM